MADNSLPDEIISEILSPALKVSDELFCDNGHISPFAKYSESTSAYLLVCKSWLRVATPLLYNIVVLRSKAQAKALSVALSGNEDLGQFIKKLRVEGGYGLPMHTILKCSPNISDLFLSFVIYSSDNTSGLCKGLPLINPTRLILRSDDYKRLENKMISQLTEALIDSISKWDRLRVFDSPYLYAGPRSKKILQALREANRLHTVVIPEIDSLEWTYPLLEGCHLKTISIKDPVEPLDLKYLSSDLKENTVLMALLKFTTVPATEKSKTSEPTSELPLITPSLDPFYIPMAGAPENVHDKIWARILYFAMSVAELANNPTTKDVSRRLPLLLVSKTFNRLGLSSYYSHVVLSQLSAVSKFASVLARNPFIGPHVRNLTINHPANHLNLKRLESDGDNVDSRVLSQTTGLVRLLQPGRQVFNWRYAVLSWDAFEAVAQSAGSTLREFSVRVEAKDLSSATIFRNLTALRTLDWKCPTSFLLTNVPEDGLQNLEQLKISPTTTQSFFRVLSLMKLQSLRRIVVSAGTFDPETLFQAHGPKLTELDLPYSKLETLSIKILELCPNLRSISLSGHIMDGKPIAADDLYSSHAVPSLVKINIDLPFWTRDKDQIAKWDGFFLKFDPKCLPNLCEIAVKGEWPTNERDIPKSRWVRWAEALLKHRINLVDEAGTKWRPRLKVK
ncbi:hypothetical protein K438DRAFT_1818723 [Mycena galopus ATCC 62051]|nr:hypothetical protein K438DRAFT_1818723 [Mycena galopus ATCC 62051]